MTSLKSTGRLVLALVMVLAGLGAAQAQTRVYDSRTGAFIDVPGASAAPSHNPIPREIVAYGENHAPGTIIVETSERRLYYVLGNGQAVKYGVGVGKEGFTWAGTNRISRKAEWPSWRPTENMIRRDPSLPRFMEGGPENPLGARALYIGSSYYRLHGTSEPWSIGQAVSSGCIRLTNEDITDLYERVEVGSRVIVRH
ncbi:L,D-transpeptidase [Pelagibacterium montanilacus]|uniref:L,D-transpeptidase n=1 Tax=Pelagibacterium montanilacus TaxID=2185280 RepID=UPI000F8D3E57|nr:L,D-transpeptidase [Pelagibacterium montanilacus]